MNISRNWLKDYVKISDKISSAELAMKLNLTTAEVEGVIDQSEKLKGVVVGELLEVTKHPNADRLSLTKVNTGNQTLEIVCGAPNIAVGQKVPVALVGTTLPNGMKIEEREVRGYKSFGMLCAEDELGLGTDHAGILILDPKVKIGTPLTEVLGLNDAILEIDNKSLSHRPDLFSHYGIAREVAAILNEKLESYKVNLREPQGDNKKLDIKVEDASLCPRYMGVVIEGIEIAESPDWLKQRVTAAGMRPINNIVDITNFVMMDIGQPLHAFDYDKLQGHKIIVRTAKKGEKIKTLDNEIRNLSVTDLVIADAKEPVAIAGVMGGANTEIDNKTQKIIIESANFNHVSIRQTEAKLNLRTEASIRFEKALDPNIAELGIKKAMALILELCPKAKLVSAVTDVADFKLNQGPINVSLDFINDRIGAQISENKVLEILTALGFEVGVEDKNFEITIPTWRATKDISIPEDIVEEVARIYGYDNLEGQLPAFNMEKPKFIKEKQLERKIKDLLAYGFDMSEVYNYSFLSAEQIENLGLEVKDFIKMVNPLSQGLDYLRRSLIPGLLTSTALNLRFYDNFNLFEIGRVFIKEEKGELVSPLEKRHLPRQDKMVAGIIVEKENETPFYTIKNYLEQVLKQLRFDYQLVKPAEVAPWYAKTRCLEIQVAGDTIGYVGELAIKIQNEFGIKQKIGLFEFDLTKLTQKFTNEMNYQTIPKFPAIELDLAFVFDKTVLWEEIYQQVIKINKDLVKEVKLLDVYEGQGVPVDKKSLAFRVYYRCADRTLTRKEAEDIQQQIIKVLEQKFKAQIRQ